MKTMTDKPTPYFNGLNGVRVEVYCTFVSHGTYTAPKIVPMTDGPDTRDAVEYVRTAVNSFAALQAVVTAAEELVKQAKNAHEELEEHELNGEDALCCLLWKDLLPGLQRSIDDTSAALAAVRGGEGVKQG